MAAHQNSLKLSCATGKLQWDFQNAMRHVSDPRQVSHREGNKQFRAISSLGGTQSLSLLLYNIAKLFRYIQVNHQRSQEICTSVRRNVLLENNLNSPGQRSKLEFPQNCKALEEIKRNDASAQLKMIHWRLDQHHWSICSSCANNLGENVA